MVPFPTTVSGKVLSDNGSWVANGTGSTNLNIGTGFRLAVPSTNNIKTLIAGFAIKMDSTSTANTITITADTSILSVKGTDTIIVNNVGTSGISLASSNGDSLKFAKLNAGANITLTSNADGSFTITSSGGGGSGITTVGAFSGTSLTNGANISGTTITFGPADPTNPGMIQASGSQTLGPAITFSVAPSIATLTTNGGVFFGNSAGTFQQAGAGTNQQVLHGGAVPFMGAVNLTTDVSNILPKVNGGTGTATPALVAGAGITITGTWPNNTITNSTLGTVTSVAMSGGTSGLTFAGGPITTSGTFTAGGILVTPNGGTGLSSYTANALIAGGSTPTGILQQVSGGTIGQFLQYQGPSALPTWANVTATTVPLNNTQIGVGNISNIMAGSSAFTFDGALLTVSANLGLKWSNGSVYLTTPSSIPASAPLENTFVGGGAGASTATGIANTGTGTSVLSHLTSGTGNVANGFNSLLVLTTGFNNMGEGTNTLSALTTGNGNIAIGKDGGSRLNTTSSQNIVIGIDSVSSAPVATNFTFIGNGYTAFRNNSANFGRADQVIRLGNGGGNTTVMNSLVTPSPSDIFYNTDSSSYLMWNGSAWIRWGGSGGGGGGGVAIDAVQTYTSGTTLTQTTGVNIIQVNPATTQSTLAVTTATSANWHNSNDLYIVPGGTILTGTVITNFSFVVGSGLTLIDDIPPTTLQAGHPLRYHKIGSLVYRYKD